MLMPLAFAVEDESTLLSLQRAQVSLDVEMQSQKLLDAAISKNVTQMQALMQNLVEESIKGDGIAQLDDDIKDAMKVIQDTLLKGIKDTLLNEHRQDQFEIMEQLKCFDGCRTARTKQERICNSHVRKFEHLVQQHKSCRFDLKAKYVSKITECNHLDDWVYNFKLDPKPLEECVYGPAYECHSVECTDADSECKPDIDGKFGKWLKRILAQATAGYDSWLILHEKCKAEYHGYIMLDSKCDMVEKEQERTNGELRQCEYTACDVEYTKCRSDCIGEYHKIVKRVECSEKDRKIDWSSTEKIECYIRILLNSPTNDELQAVCEDGKNCISKWRTHEYDKCNAVCPNVDYGAKDAAYEQHERRDAVSGQYLHIHDKGHAGVDAINVEDGGISTVHPSTQANIQHADDLVAGDRTAGVNTTHRRKDGGDEKRCTWHLDIDFQPIPCAIPCREPRPCCDDKYKELYESEFMKVIDITELSGKRVCHKQAPGEHTEKWAYNLCGCCESHCQLIGTPAIEDDDYCPCPSHAEAPEVYMEYKQTNVCFHTKDEQPGSLTLPPHMCVDRMTFTHRSGRVTCRSSTGDRDYSNWGCEADYVAVVMTKADSRDVIMPLTTNTAGFTRQPNDNHWYKMDGVTRDGEEMVWQIKDGVYDLKLEGNFKLWYTEDLKDYTEHDNEGQVCYDVEVFGEWC